MKVRWICLVLLSLLLWLPADGRQAQQAPPEKQAAEQKPPVEQKPAEQKPVTAPIAEQQPATPQQQATLPVLNIPNAQLTDVIDVLARELKLNYILDPRVGKGSVTVNTYGELRGVDGMALLQTILRVNSAALVKVGDFYRIVPLGDVAARMPIEPQQDAKSFAPDERLMLNLVFLKYATVAELGELLKPFIGEGGSLGTYPPANLLLILDNSRNMRRTMQLISMFDSDVLANQRVRLFEVVNGRPSDIAKELESVMKAVSLGGEKSSPVKFLPIDRINTVVAIAPNPGVFEQVEQWLKKLDTPVKVTAGSTENYVYRVKYGRAEMLAAAITALYSGNSQMLGMMTMMGGGCGLQGGGGGGYGGGYGGYGGGAYGGGMYGGGMYGGMGAYGGMGGYGGMGAYGGMYGGPGMYGGGYGGGYPGYAPQQAVAPAAPAGSTPFAPAGTAAASTDLTGSFLGPARASGGNVPRVIPNPFDNSLLIQANPGEYAQIVKLLERLDLPPRQALIEARIYEVNMQGDFAAGVQAFLQRKDAALPKGIATRTLEAFSSSAGLALTAGALVGESRVLLGILTASEESKKAKLVAAPSLIATDCIPASINVGDEVPTLAAQAVNGNLQQSGSSLFTQSIMSRQTGVTLNVLARINPSGIVTLEINQVVSAPVAPSANSAIPSPSFSNRTVQTQVTVQDGDMIAIAGIINEADTSASAGIPVLNRIPILGAAFGTKAITKTRTELVIFMTPRVIYDTNQMAEATNELKSGLKRLNKIIPQ